MTNLELIGYCIILDELLSRNSEDDSISWELKIFKTFFGSLSDFSGHVNFPSISNKLFDIEIQKLIFIIKSDSESTLF